MLAAAEAGPDGTYVNAPQLGVDPLAQDDQAGKSVGLSGAAEAPPHIRCISPLSGPNLTIDLIVQLDTITPAQQILIARTGSSAGAFSVEALAGGRLRAFSYTSETAPFMRS